MAVTAGIYPKMFESALLEEIKLDTDTVKVMLCTSASNAYSGRNTVKYKADVTNEVTGTGYTAGGVTLSGTRISSATGAVYTFDFSTDPVWTTSTITARYAVFYDDTPTNKPLLVWWDFGQDEISSSGNFTLTLSASGIFTLTAS
ncbi:hypothetical protein SEA_GODONK_93 [Gordonia phage GodonK]|uniref:Uncharacterized protein n=1 Tax=Gordonia phage GodonK TaxID=2562192 RepID=A0A4D6E3T7_9CAUD|nr:hypothetical protein HOV33_gp093 [Gordonia phage GodonK]QBZ72712.1 hypothetical protein SEA_GODONK_93 [Gordonia phage GodonK]